MPAPKNPLKEWLHTGQTNYGCWLGMRANIPAEIAATAGFDWLLIDAEHGPNDIGSIQSQLQTLAAFDSHSILRPPAHDTWMLKQALDAGVQSFLMPMVNTADEAKAIVAATRYPPHGKRGIGAALARASQFNGIPDYLHTANDQICVVAQIETQEALDNIEAIAAVDGIDALFIGPSDLSADMGFTGRADAPEPRAAIADGLARITATGKAAGYLALTHAGVAQARAQGATMIGAGIDVLILANALRDLAKTLKADT